MSKFISNPDLLNLIGMKFHVRETTQCSHFPPQVREFLASANLNDERYIHSVIFNADSAPEIGLVQNINHPDRMEFYRSTALLFSPPAGSSQPLPSSVFNQDGSLIAALNDKQSVAARMAFRPSAQTLALNFNTENA